MSGATNPLVEMGHLDTGFDAEKTRPNPSFAATVLPGFKKALEGRRAVRMFDRTPIPAETMRDCLRDATLAPSSSNLQCYELYWVRDPGKKKTLAKQCLGQPAAESAGDMIVVVSRVDQWESHLNKLTALMTHGGQKPMTGPIRDYYENIVPMLMRTDPWGLNNLKRRVMFWLKRRSEPCVTDPVSRADHRIYGHVQASLAAENLMLSLAAHGYESCPMGGIDKHGIAELLRLPDGAEVTMVIAAGTGTPQGLYNARVRLPYDDLVKEV